MPRLGICFTGQPYRLREVVEAAQLAERLGYESVWVAEDAWTGRDAVTVLTAVAMNTSLVRIGTCLVGATTRHPVLTAMTFNTLRELAPGRLVLGVGYAGGWQATLTSQRGTHGDSPLRTMHETVAALRSLLRGGEAEWGHQSRRMVIPRPWFAGAIEPRSEPVPIYMGAVGPKMTRLAGEIADGLLLEMEAVREFLPGRLQLFREGAAVSGRDPLALETVKLILASVGPEATTPSGRAVHHNALGWAAKSVSLVDGETVRKLKWDAERAYRIKSAWAAGDWEAGKDAMTPEMTLAFVAAGPPEHLAGVIRDTVATGVTTPVLIPYGGELRPLIEAGARFINGL